MIGQFIAVLWEIAAVGFLVLVTLTIRKARARGKRPFADEPTARVRSLRKDTSHQYEQDAL